MRRKDREKDKAFAESIADKCEWAVISMITPDNKPYCIPITIVREDSKIYFHSAKEGFKTDCLKNDPSVCISCVGDTCRQTDRFTTLFESAVIRGTASEVTSDEEKIHALKILCERHTPANMADFDSAIERSLARTAVWRIDIEDITGKAKK
ncbi:MAG: pyridoxamine 5'-phosphate oxidase family protein [Oscillospiraceae bacterium]